MTRITEQMIFGALGRQVARAQTKAFEAQQRAQTGIRVARPADVCKCLQLDTSTLSRNVERMRARAWLEVVDDDGRAQPFRLTAKGRRLLERAMPAWKKAQEKVKKLIGADTVASIDAAVRRIRSATSKS